MRLLGFNTFQILFIAALVALGAAALWGLRRRRLSRTEGLLWASVCALAGIAVAAPDLTVTLARALGIGRGTDLLLYLAVLVMMVGFSATYLRLRDLRREITVLVRHLAIYEAMLGERVRAPAADEHA